MSVWRGDGIKKSLLFDFEGQTQTLTVNILWSGYLILNFLSGLMLDSRYLCRESTSNVIRSDYLFQAPADIIRHVFPHFRNPSWNSKHNHIIITAVQVKHRVFVLLRTNSTKNTLTNYWFPLMRNTHNRRQHINVKIHLKKQNTWEWDSKIKYFIEWTFKAAICKNCPSVEFTLKTRGQNITRLATYCCQL